MTFLEIIKSEATNLPIQYGGSFRELIKRKMNHFGDLVDNSTDLSDDKLFKPDIFKRRNKAIREGIIKTIDKYYEGDPTNAFKMLADAMRAANISGYLDKQHNLERGHNLFRIRLGEMNYPYSKAELFHIPFELRGKVQTQRYSIPGLPSLYVSNSIYVAWEELKRPSSQHIQAVRLVNRRPLQLLDLTSDVFANHSHLTDNNAYGWQLLYKVMVWPLVAACSVRVQAPGDSFKPEYIIPQLLLQWVNKSKVYGIKYSSTHIDLNQTRHEGHFYNIVFPVRTFNIDNGQCPLLLKMFRSTNVVPLQLRQFLTQSDRLMTQASVMRDVNPDIDSIELVKGHPQGYAWTTFGILEHTLKGIEAEDF